MTVFADIQSALNTRLNTLSGGYAVAWENIEYEPVQGTPYLRPTFLPAETFGATIGATGTDNQSGIYQIDVFVKAGQGHGAAVILADSIADHFKPVTELVYNGRLVRCMSVSILRGRSDNGWYQVPIEIRYLALTTKR